MKNNQEKIVEYSKFAMMLIKADQHNDISDSTPTDEAVILLHIRKDMLAIQKNIGNLIRLLGEKSTEERKEILGD